MFASFFIDRPVFACVISIIITLLGLVALRALPIEQYPNITPPQIQIGAVYPGADATTVALNVAAPIEQQINGVENMIYMNSQNSANGDMSLTVFFEIGTDADIAQVNVQNRINMALPQLPFETQQIGVTVKKQTPNILLVVTMQSPNGTYDDIALSNYATINVVDELLRVPGISDVQIVNARDYSMRLWLRPDRMAQMDLTTTDIVEAVKEQNSNFGIGQIGRTPTSGPVQLTLPIATKGRLSTTEEFENIILRGNEDGSFVTMKDIGRAELGAQNYDVDGELNGKNASVIAIYQQFGANALDVAEDVKKTLDRLSKNFPEGIVYQIPYDTTNYIRKSIGEVVKTIFEAAFLVCLVVLIFLQRFRATIVPILAMVVSIVGTFAGMYVLGFSINTLTLFGLVLAVGTVVDDAIVVIENIERNIRELGLSAKMAAHKAMEEVSGPVVAIVFVLCAVFLPVAFLGGIAGQLYRQFAITIAVSVVISGIVALTLSPALAVILLEKASASPSRLGQWFNRHFDRLTELYIVAAKKILDIPLLGGAIFIGVLALLGLLVYTTPMSFVPEEDQGYLIAAVTLPDGASLQRTEKIDQEVYELAAPQPGVENVLAFSGFSMLDGSNRPSAGANFITLTDWDVRKAPELQAHAIQKSLSQKYANIPEAQIWLLNPPAIQGLGTVGGFEFWIESRGEAQMEKLEEVVGGFIAKANKLPELQHVMSTIQANNMQLFVDLDRYKARALGVSIADVFQSLQVLMGSLYINDFNKFGRTFRVTAQAEPSFRAKISDIDEIYVRSKTGQMVPLSALIKVNYSKGPTLVTRFNGFAAGKIFGSAAPGYSSGEAMNAMEKLAATELPEGMTYSWSGESYQEKATGGKSTGVLIGGIVMVFLILCALYERWSLPLAVICAIPFGLLGAFLAIWIRGTTNDVYFQVGLVTLIALAAKNAILIVEFALLKYQEGLPLAEAALEAAKLRFRAILMTSLTFILGVLPLVFAQGAGAASRQSVGTGVFGGMIAATILAVLLVPLFFKLIVQWTENGSKKNPH
ncbi:MAG: multidrug efflux RND transporter permease subunit [Parachlamydiaceae bacterium]|nr:multidrug efflux RND transporter permease subunit [Parachlamydiaceae bacterium]